MKIRPLILTVIFLFISCGPLTAATITSLYGDQDGFGKDIHEGETFNPLTLQQSFGIYNQFPTDEWSNRGILELELGWTHTYSLDGLGPLTSACLEIFTGGQGDFGDSKLFLDGQQVGTIPRDGGNFARRHVLDLSAFIKLFDGSNTFRLQTAFNLKNNQIDNWVLDYSALSVSDDRTCCVPLPSSLLLLAGGCLGLWGCRKKVKRKN